jgi:accessory gene regulator protein AgrB
MHAVNFFAMLYGVSLTRHLLTLVVVAAVIEWLFGGLWYGVIFRKSWTKLVGLAEGEKPKNRIFGLIVSLVACLVITYLLAHIVGWAGSRDLLAGASVGIIISLGLVAPPLLAQHVFENRRANLFAINACYWLLAMAIGGGIMGAFHG